jgi:hypothetical protein
MSEIKARPTLYKGIEMRSRLEADYAACLDRDGEPWEYEPVCFASDEGQWLPDFRIGELGNLVELKSAHLLERADGESGDEVVARIDVILKQMAIAWHSEPRTWLELVFWTYGGWEPVFTIVGGGRKPTWATFGPGLLSFPLLWPGMGQLAVLDERNPGVAS